MSTVVRVFRRDIYQQRTRLRRDEAKGGNPAPSAASGASWCSFVTGIPQGERNRHAASQADFSGRIARYAAKLQLCPGALLKVSGRTDIPGPDGARLRLCGAIRCG